LANCSNLFTKSFGFSYIKPYHLWIISVLFLPFQFLYCLFLFLTLLHLLGPPVQCSVEERWQAPLSYSSSQRECFQYIHMLCWELLANEKHHMPLTLKHVFPKIKTSFYSTTAKISIAIILLSIPQSIFKSCQLSQ